MKTTAFAIALLIGGAAIAQTTTVQTTTQPDVDVDADLGVQPDGDLDVDADVDVDTETTTTTTTTTPHGTMTHSTTTDGTATHTTMAATTTPASGPVVQPSNAAPEHDARGIAVISDPAAVPAGWNGVSGTSVGGPLVDPATGQTVGAEASYPACTATVTDNCVQTYERGRPR